MPLPWKDFVGHGVHTLPDFSVHSFQRLARHLNFLTVSVVPCERNTRAGGGEAGSEVWNRVYMTAPVKKFGRVRLSTNFP